MFPLRIILIEIRKVLLLPEYEILKQLLTEGGSIFPAKVDVICGRTLAKTKTWWKAILLVKLRNNKYQLRLYGWQWNSKKKEYSQRQKFNLSASKYLVDIVFFLQAFIQDASIEGTKKTIDNKLLDKIYSLENKLNKQRMLAQKNRIPEMEKQIKKFQRILRKTNRTEKEIQEFLYNNFWMFGAFYKSVRKEQKAGMKKRNDFLIKKEGEFYDIVELKKPEHKLFTSAKNPSIHSDLKNAISQMASYLDYYHKHYLSFREQTDLNVLYPKGIIVIGRRKETDIKLLKAHELIWGKNIEVLTYDDILDRAKQSIKNIKKRKK